MTGPWSHSQLVIEGDVVLNMSNFSSFSMLSSMSSSMWKIAIGAPLSPHRRPFCYPHPGIRAPVGQKTIFLITPSHQVWFPREWFSSISSPCGTQMFSEAPYATSGKKHVGVLMGITVGPMGSIWNKINGTDTDDGIRAVSSDWDSWDLNIN